MEFVPWLISIPALVALMFTLLNAVVWPRGRRGSVSQTVSVLIPARNEEKTIGATVRAALAQPVTEVIVYDDQSTDSTPEILQDARPMGPLVVVQGEPLPPGWVGKPHACHQLAKHASGDVLLFLDADVTLSEGGVERILGILEDFEADVVTAVPRQRVGGFFERLILPLLHVTYVSWLPMPLVWRSRDPRFLAANGQILAVRRTAYDAVGGFEAVSDAVVDDMAFCTAQKKAGRRVVFADGHDIAECRMYTSPREVWEGFSKNIYEGIGSVPGLFVAIALFLATFVLPWVALLFGPGYLAPAAVGVSANIAQRLILAVRHRQPLEGPVLVPVAVLALCAIALNSFIWHLRNDIQWSGRSYARKAARRG